MRADSEVIDEEVEAAEQIGLDWGGLGVIALEIAHGQPNLHLTFGQQLSCRQFRRLTLIS